MRHPKFGIPFGDSIRRILALYCVFGGPTRRFLGPCVVLDYAPFYPKNHFSEKSADRCTNRSVDRVSISKIVFFGVKRDAIVIVPMT